MNRISRCSVEGGGELYFQQEADFQPPPPPPFGKLREEGKRPVTPLFKPTGFNTLDLSIEKDIQALISWILI